MALTDKQLALLNSCPVLKEFKDVFESMGGTAQSSSNSETSNSETSNSETSNSGNTGNDNGSSNDGGSEPSP